MTDGDWEWEWDGGRRENKMELHARELQIQPTTAERSNFSQARTSPVNNAHMSRNHHLHFNVFP